MALTYVLITPAYNEQAYIEKTVKSMIAQTVIPKMWIIVNDGSTDNTLEIVENYAKDRKWIKLINKSKKEERNFAAKVEAFDTGYEVIKNLEYDIIGNLDADISFDKDYFEYLLEKFEDDPQLGVAGTDYIEGDFHSFKDSYINVHHVNGQCQLFRRACFEDIGGYTPIKGGGIDWIAVTTARMKGWHTMSFPDRVFNHHRLMGTAGSNVYISRYKYGKKDYFLGGHPLWEICRGIFQMTKKPYILGGIFLMTGYFWSMMKRKKIHVSKELIEFNRYEQKQRLKSIFINGLDRGN